MNYIQVPFDSMISRDDVCVTMLNEMNLNRYDHKFIQNIALNYIDKNRPLTQKQSDVFEIIVNKYKKQFRKSQKIDFRDILNLDWKNGICSEEQLQQQTFLKIEDGLIKLYFNFNKELINDVRAIVHDDEQNHLNKDGKEFFSAGAKYDFVWNKFDNYWAGPFEVHLFRQIHKFAVKNNIHIDKSVDKLFEKIDSYGSKESWTPSIQKVNDRLYVNIISEGMLPVLDDFDLSDTSIKNIDKLANTLALDTSSLYNSNISELMQADKTTTVCYDTSTQEGQDSLLNYLKMTGKRSIFILLNNGFFDSINSDKNKNTFIIASPAAGGIKNWDIPKMIIGRNEVRNTFSTVMKDIKGGGYDTIVTPMSIEELITTSKEFGAVALNAAKFIKIK